VTWADLWRSRAESARIAAKKIDHLITIERKDDEGRRVLEHFGEPRMWLRLHAGPRRLAVIRASVTSVTASVT
jgi:hypothetical protein